MRVKGKIASWNDEKGFGFINPISGGNQVFVHIKAFKNQNRRPEKNKIVVYSISTDDQGRSFAINAALSGDHLTTVKKGNNGSLSIFIAILYIIIVGGFVLASKTHPVIFGIYIVMSFLTFIVYAKDKSAAKNGTWRTQESTLHFLSLIGGWPGALVAQQKLRHKSKKKPFRVIFWITVLVNIGIFYWLSTPPGLSLSKSLVSGVLETISR